MRVMIFSFLGVLLNLGSMSFGQGTALETEDLSTQKTPANNAKTSVRPAVNPLTASDKELLLEKLEAIRQGSVSLLSKKHSVALNAFRAAAASDASAVALYLDCVEKVRFTDNARKAGDFRSWRKRFKENDESPALRRALRYQLQWLVLTIQASARRNNLSSMKGTALKQVGNMLADHETLDGAEGTLSSSVLDTDFAKAYELDGLPVGKWPPAPLNFDSLYSNLVFPDLREEGDIKALREAWQQRITWEGKSIQEWGDTKNTAQGRNPRFEKWFEKTRPQLEFAMLVDLFNFGDQQKASLEIIKFLEKHSEHESAPDWINTFTNLVLGKKQVVKVEKEDATE